MSPFHFVFVCVRVTTISNDSSSCHKCRRGHSRKHVRACAYSLLILPPPPLPHLALLLALALPLSLSLSLSHRAIATSQRKQSGSEMQADKSMDMIRNLWAGIFETTTNDVKPRTPVPGASESGTRRVPTECNSRVWQQKAVSTTDSNEGRAREEMPPKQSEAVSTIQKQAAARALRNSAPASPLEWQSAEHPH